MEAFEGEMCDLWRENAAVRKLIAATPRPFLVNELWYGSR